MDDFYADLSRYLFEEKLVEYCLIAEGILLCESFNPKDIEFGTIKITLTGFAVDFMLKV
ncbi:hypothetical protein [Priestia aryabhattai]|uniref:hypothetical protein n=1 Tax=Priestia aryabhattai TaxID=412384 RepID=UPI001FB515DA|nr:hypothetical protein [Priestia aryabhattai]